MQHSLTALHVHIVFATHGRERVLTDLIRPRAHAYLAGICRNQNVHVHAVGGAQDHVHLGINLRSDLPLASLVRDLKSNSSLFISRETRRVFAWQRGYSAFSVGPSSVARLVHYIETQMEHHRRRSFQEELEQLWAIHEVTPHVPAYRQG